MECTGPGTSVEDWNKCSTRNAKLFPKFGHFVNELFFPIRLRPITKSLNKALVMEVTLESSSVSL